MWGGIDHFVAIHDNQHLGVGVLPSSKTVGQRHPQKSIEDAFCHGNQSNCHGNCQIATQLAASNVINGKSGKPKTPVRGTCGVSKNDFLFSVDHDDDWLDANAMLQLPWQFGSCHGNFGSCHGSSAVAMAIL